jgi:Tfp pilus assembly protein PilN
VIRTNIATRPFEEERAIQRWLGLAGGLVLAATLANTWALVHYTRSDSELKAQAAHDEARAVELRTEATRLRRTAATAAPAAVASETERARALVTRRTFSWTDLFTQLEATLPPEARITSIRPSIRERDRTALEIAIVARGVDAVDRFLRSLEETGQFTGVLSRDERVNEDGQIEAFVVTAYVPAGQTP